MGNHIQTGKVLLRDGANVNARQKHQRTALHYAVQKDFVELAVLLLQRKADPTAKNNKDEDPFTLAKSDQVRSALEQAKADRAAKQEKDGKVPQKVHRKEPDGKNELQDETANEK